MPTIAATFTLILANLRKAIGAGARRDLARVALYDRVWMYLERAANRLARLHAQFLAGALPRPRAPRPSTPRDHSAPRLPSGFAWLTVLVPGIPVFGTQIEYLLNTHPDAGAFLAACPQAARIIRPIWHMLGVRPNPGGRAHALLPPPRTECAPRPLPARRIPRRPRAPGQPVPTPPPARPPALPQGPSFLASHIFAPDSLWPV